MFTFADVSRAALKAAGWSDGDLDWVEREGLQFVKVTVLEPCGCEMCVAGRRWFHCLRYPETVIGTYAVVGDAGVPWASAVARLEKQFPGKTLLYCAGGAGWRER
jgi:hypothetical protein